jgi:hypothetical protein
MKDDLANLLSLGILGISIYLADKLSNTKYRKNPMNSYFVVRDTDHPEDDLKRNWSSFLGGWDNELGGIAFDSEEEAAEADMNVNGGERRTYRYHPAYDGYVLVHFDGLGAYALDSDNLNDALKEAKDFEDDLNITMEQGNGHFYANQVISFHKVKDGRYVFEIKI